MVKDERAERFRSLYESSRPRLLAYALRRTQSPEDAADVIAETFTVAWRRLDDIPDGEASVLWLFAAARRVTANHTRRSHYRAELVRRIGNHLATSSANDLDPSNDEAMESAIALARMSDDDRELLMLAGWEGLDSNQLAFVLGCSPTAARIRLHHARRRLRAALLEFGVWTKQPSGSRHSQSQVAVSTDTPEEVQT